MAKLVFLKILDGNFDEGFIVDMQIFDEFDNHRRLINSPDRFMMTESHTGEGFHSLNGI
jgi:hypothetical protein